MKNFKFLLIPYLLFLFCYNSFSQGGDNWELEIYVYNYTTQQIFIQLYPISAVFNGYNLYNLLGKCNIDQQDPLLRYDCINGTAIINCGGGVGCYSIFTKTINPYGASNGYNNDLEEGSGFCSSIGEYGFGRYKLDIRYDNSGTINDRKDSCIIDFDYYEIGPSGPGDLWINVYPNNIIKYKFQNNNEVQISYSSPDYYTARCWHPNEPYNETNSRPKRFGPQGNGFFTYKVETDPIKLKYNRYNWFPLDSRKDCDFSEGPGHDNNQNQQFPFFPNSSTFFDDERQGILTLNLWIRKDVSTPTEYWDSRVTYPAPIIVIPNAQLDIGSNCSLSLLPVPYNFQDRIMKIQTDAWLILDEPSAQNDPNTHPTLIDIYNKNMLILEKNSNLYMNLINPPQNPSLIKVHDGGGFCDYGAEKIGSLNVVYQAGTHWLVCPAIKDNIFDDSTLVSADSSAIIIIPDSTNLIIDGNYSRLKATTTTIFKFGANAKLILQNGAHLIADHATFTSLDPNSTWDGIYLYDISHDTITNCTIENASNGINIKNK